MYTKIAVVVATIIGVVIIAALLLMPSGPGRGDLAKVKIAPGNESCSEGSASFAITNGTDYAIKYVEFRVWGFTSGSSNKIDVGINLITYDRILAHQSFSGCWSLNYQHVPSGQKLTLLEPETQSVGFVTKSGATKIVY